MSARTGIKAVKLAAVGCTSILAMTSAPAAAQVVCATDLAGVLNCDAPTPAPPTPPSGTINLNALVQPVVVALPPNFESTVTALIDTTGPITITGDAVIDTVLDNEPALDLTSGADINAQVRRLTTIGDNSTGALLQAVDGVVLTVDDLVSTLGDNSDGVNIQAGNASVTLDEVQTAGVNAQGVEIVTVSGPATLDASLIEADANKQNSTPKEEWDAKQIDPAGAPRAVREYLDTLDEAAFGAASEVQPKFTSHSDPASQWTAARKGPAFPPCAENRNARSNPW